MVAYRLLISPPPGPARAGVEDEDAGGDATDGGGRSGRAEEGREQGPAAGRRRRSSRRWGRRGLVPRVPAPRAEGRGEGRNVGPDARAGGRRDSPARSV